MAMRKAFAFSVILHLAVLLLAYFGIPMAQRELIVSSEPVVIDVVSVADTTNLPPLAAEPKKPAPAAKLDPKPKVDPGRPEASSSAANLRPQPPALLKPETETETETEKALSPPKADPPVQAKPQQIQQVKPQQPAKVQPQQAKPQQAAKAETQPPPQLAPVPEPDKAAEPVPPPRPVPQRKKPAQAEQALAAVAKSEPVSAPPEAKPAPAADFQSVLKTVGTLSRSDVQKPTAEKATPAETEVKQANKEAKKADSPEQAFTSLIKGALGSGAATPATTPSASGRTYDAAQPITVSEIDEVRRQIERCWNVAAGARDAGDYVVTIRVEMRPDATPRSATVLNEATMHGSAFYRATAESALRAVLNPRCHPFKLPVEKYDRWKTMTLVFNPKDMLGT